MADSVADSRPDAGPSERAVRAARAVWLAGIVSLVVIGMLSIVFFGGGDRAHHHGFFPGDAGAEEDGEVFDPQAVSMQPPPWQTEEVLDSIAETGKPCSGCHNAEDLPPNPERRELDAHEDIVLKHDERNRWCLDCHDAENRDMLRLASGVLVPYEESYRLCGQCHGDKYRDWRRGIHGRRVGLWNGRKEYRLCVHCHWSHAPRFEPITPRPAPLRPGVER